MSQSARSAQTSAHRGLNGRTDHIAERHDANWHGDWDRRHAHFDHGHFFVFDDGFWYGLDDGFYPWDYLPYYADDYYPYDYYADVQPADNTAPADNSAPRLIPRSRRRRRSLINWATTVVQSMAFSVRRRVTRWRSIKSHST